MEQHPTTLQTGIRYGVILGLISIIISAISFLANIEQNTIATVISVVITIAGIYMAHKYFKDEGDGFMSYGQGLGIGTLASVVAGALGGIFSFLYLSFIDDSPLKKAMEQQRIKFEEQGMGDDQIEQAMAMAEKFSSPLMALIFSIVFSLIFGFIISLIVSAITKNVNPEEQI